MFKKVFLGLAVFWCANVLAQLPQPSPGRPTLGVLLCKVDGKPDVVMVAEVGKGAPAAAAGFLPGDFVVRIGERAITTIDEVIAALDQVSPGASIEIGVRRGDQEQTLRATPGAPRQ